MQYAPECHHRTLRRRAALAPSLSLAFSQYPSAVRYWYCPARKDPRWSADDQTVLQAMKRGCYRSQAVGNWSTAGEGVAEQLILKFGFGINGRCPMRAGGTDNVPCQHCQGDPSKDLLRGPRHCVRIVPAKYERHTMPPGHNHARMGINCGI